MVPPVTLLVTNEKASPIIFPIRWTGLTVCVGPKFSPCENEYSNSMMSYLLIPVAVVNRNVARCAIMK